MNYIKVYLKKIRENKINVSKRVKKQYEKLVYNIDNPGKYVFDIKKANKPILFIEKFCKHSKGKWAGQPLKLDLWQKAYIQALFGFVDKETGLRQYRESMLLVGRKNGKTTMLAGIALYMLIADGEGGSEVYSVASKKDQANILFEETHNMVKQSKHLARHIRKRKSDLYFEVGFSKLQSLGKNSDTLDGLNAHLVIMDELHSIRDRNLYEVMQQSQSAREEPLMVMITTAGTVRECIFDDMYDYACNVVDETFEDEHFLPLLYELDEKKEWKDPDMWEKANPGLGTIKNIEDLQRKVNRATNSPNDLAGILTKDFNIRETLSTAWLTFEIINNESKFDINDFKGSYAIGGADLSKTGDLTCATLLMMKPDEDIKYITQMYWLPKDRFFHRVQEDKIPYDKWHEQGLLRLCEGNTISYSDVTNWFNEMLNEYSITPLWIYYDSWSAKYWVEEMESYGFVMERTIQGAKTLSLPMEKMGLDLEAKKINYNNNPILKWCLTNTAVQRDRNNNIVPIKQNNPKMKIDGMSSLLNSYVGLMDHYEEFKRAL